ncbi:transglutaminase-like domain-containing protein [Ruminococcus flavefaciens]|uniref:transglutaminase-like domain-containing protein n=1 Tax=Ruminococcus flavefaciens TaxID=1265 RepID=UPI0026F1EA72|nr:transglutaminase-like domain-containing protein [Ruminococcus flavefaciens]
MKRKNIQNSNGITISDSIVMSVKQKHPSMRKLFSVVITLIGMLSVIMAFLGMFHFRYEKSTVVTAFICFAALHILVAVRGQKLLGVYFISVLSFLFLAYRKSATLVMGFKFVYNIIYKSAFTSKINYYKGLKSALEVSSVTTLFVFYIWLLAIVICYFTICRPNPVLPLMVTFPLLEIGMYNGIKMPVFWGILCIAYWLAILAMSTIDVGEYSGGQSGFVRKNNLFFPKRHMKLKVTERCGMFIITSVMLLAALSYGYLKVTHYKRSDSINEKRRNITEAVEDFSIDNLGESLANLSNAFGFNLDYENHKLGNLDHVRYKNITDLTVTLEKPVYGAIYLKDDTCSVYRDNEWFKLPSSNYKSKVFDDFNDYKMHPQCFPATMFRCLIQDDDENTIWIKNSPRKKKHVYVPYGIEDFGKLKYENDTNVIPDGEKKGESSYKFVNINTDAFKELFNMQYDLKQSIGDLPVVIGSSQSTPDVSMRSVFSASSITDPKWRDKILKYCTENDLISYDDYFTFDNSSFDFIYVDPSYLYEHGEVVMTKLMQESYRDFVYQNYLDVPDTAEMEEVRQAYSDIIDREHGNTAHDVFSVLDDIRIRISATSTYSLEPGKLPSGKDFVNWFLLENHKGYCTSYASSGVLLARMAGIPARYATGYIISENDLKSGKKNKDNTLTVEVKDNRSHAWAEIYIEGLGWIPYEFTAGYTSGEITTEPTQPTTAVSTSASDISTTTTSGSSTANNSNTSAVSRTTVTTTVLSTVTSIAGNGGKGIKIHIPKFVRNLFILILFAALLVMFVRARRAIILKIRDKHLTTGEPETRIRYMYSYAEKLLSEMNMQSENGNFKQFASEVEKWYGDIAFEKGSFDLLTDVALRSAFNSTKPSSDELKKCEKMLSSLSASLFKKSSRFDKFRLMYLNVLVKGDQYEDR